MKTEIERMIALIDSDDDWEDEMYDFLQDFNYVNEYPDLTYKMVLKAVRISDTLFDCEVEYNESFRKFLSSLSKKQYEELIPLLIEQGYMPYLENCDEWLENFYEKLITLFQSGPENMRAMVATRLIDSIKETYFSIYDRKDVAKMFFAILYAEPYDADMCYSYFNVCEPEDTLFEETYLKDSVDKKTSVRLKELRDYYVGTYLLDGDNLVSRYEDGVISESFFYRIIADMKADNPELFQKVQSEILTTYRNEDLVNMLNQAFLGIPKPKKRSNTSLEDLFVEGIADALQAACKGENLNDILKRVFPNDSKESKRVSHSKNESQSYENNSQSVKKDGKSQGKKYTNKKSNRTYYPRKERDGKEAAQSHEEETRNTFMGLLNRGYSMYSRFHKNRRKNK